MARTPRTPAGGDRSEAVFFTADGQRTTNEDEAAAVEITEYADGVVVNRTHMRRTGGLPRWKDPAGAVSEPDMADSPKGTWDVMLMEDGIMRLVVTLPDLLTALNVDRADEAEQRRKVRHLMEQPSWIAAPDGLKRQVDEWL